MNLLRTVVRKTVAGEVRHTDGLFAVIQKIGIDGIEKNLLLDEIQIHIEDTGDTQDEFRHRFPVGAILHITTTVEVTRTDLHPSEGLPTLSCTADESRHSLSKRRPRRKPSMLGSIHIGDKFIFRSSDLFGGQFTGKKPSFEGQMLTVVDFKPRYVNNIVARESNGNIVLLPLETVEKGLRLMPAQ